MNRCAYVLCAMIAVAFVSQGQTSRNGKFTAVIARDHGAKNSREHTTWSAKIFDKTGSVRYQLLNEIPFDNQYPSLYLADDGCSIVVSVFNGIIEFHDNTGNVVRELEPFGKKTAEHEQIIKCSVAGERVTFLFSTPEAANAVVLMTNLQGGERWRKSLRGKQAAEVYLASSSKYVVAGSYTMESALQSYSQVLDENGKQVALFDTMFRFADIADDGRIVLASRNTLRLFHLTQPTSRFNWNTRRKQDIITGVKIVGRFVASSVEGVEVQMGVPAYMNPALIILNSQGTVITKSHLNSSSKTPATLTVGKETAWLSSGTSSTSVSLANLR